jgi:hypothetical protein
MTLKLSKKTMKQAMAQAMQTSPKTRGMTLNERFATLSVAKLAPKKSKAKKVKKTRGMNTMNGSTYATAVLYPHLAVSTTPIPDGGSGRVLTYVIRTTVDLSSITSSAAVVVLPAVGMNVLYSTNANTFTTLKPPTPDGWSAATSSGASQFLGEMFKYRTIGLGLQVIPTTPPLSRGGTQVITRLPLNAKYGPVAVAPSTGGVTGNAAQIESFDLTFPTLASRPGALVCNTDRGVAGAAIRQDVECEWNTMANNVPLYASYPGDYSVPAEGLCVRFCNGIDEQFGGLIWRVQAVPTGQSYTAIVTHVVEGLTQIDSQLYQLAAPRPTRNVPLIERVQKMADMTDGVGIVSSEGTVVWRSDANRGTPMFSNVIKPLNSRQMGY